MLPRAFVLLATHSARILEPFGKLKIRVHGFFLCSAIRLRNPSPFTKKAAEQGGQWEWSSEGTTSGPLRKRPVEGGGGDSEGEMPKGREHAGCAIAHPGKNSDLSQVGGAKGEARPDHTKRRGVAGSEAYLR